MTTSEKQISARCVVFRFAELQYNKSMTNWESSSWITTSWTQPHSTLRAFLGGWHQWRICKNYSAAFHIHIDLINLMHTKILKPVIRLPMNIFQRWPSLSFPGWCFHMLKLFIHHDGEDGENVIEASKSATNIDNMDQNHDTRSWSQSFLNHMSYIHLYLLTFLSKFKKKNDFSSYQIFQLFSFLLVLVNNRQYVNMQKFGSLRPQNT